MRRLGLIGAGGMAATVLEALAAHLPAPLEHVTILVRPGSEAKAEAVNPAEPLAVSAISQYDPSFRRIRSGEATP